MLKYDMKTILILLILIQATHSTVPLQLEKSAWLGDVQARYDLGLSFYRGKLHKQSYESAFYWFLQNAYSKHIASIYNIGIMYEAGDGVSQDNVKAQLFFQMATELGDFDAEYRYEELLDKMTKAQIEQVKQLRVSFLFRLCSKEVDYRSSQATGPMSHVSNLDTLLKIPYLDIVQCKKDDSK